MGHRSWPYSVISPPTGADPGMVTRCADRSAITVTINGDSLVACRSAARHQLAQGDQFGQLRYVVTDPAAGDDGHVTIYRL